MIHNSDGKFRIEQGQGISQAIVKELGLTEQEVGKLGKSIWMQIFACVDEQNKQNLQKGKDAIYTGGNNAWGNIKENYIVKLNQAIEFSKEIWDKIIEMVSGNLAKGNVNSRQPEGSASSISSANTLSKEEQFTQEDLNVDIINVQEVESEAKTISNNLKIHLSEYPILFMGGDVDGELQVTKELLEQIDPENVAYVVSNIDDIAQQIANINHFGRGFDNKDVYEYVIKNLIDRANELGMSDIPKIDANSSLSSMKKFIADVAEKIKAKDLELNNIKEVFNKASNVLFQATKMNPKPKVETYIPSPEETEIPKSKTITVQGYSIVAFYDENDEIFLIRITEPQDSQESRKKQPVDYDKSYARFGSVAIKTGYNFDAIKKVIEYIMGE